MSVTQLLSNDTTIFEWGIEKDVDLS